MWSLLTGIVIGVLQAVTLAVLKNMIFSKSIIKKLTGCLLLFAKMAAIVFILVLISKVSLTMLVYAACGMLAGLIAALAFIYTRRAREGNAND